MSRSLSVAIRKRGILILFICDLNGAAFILLFSSCASFNISRLIKNAQKNIIIIEAHQLKLFPFFNAIVIWIRNKKKEFVQS